MKITELKVLDLHDLVETLRRYGITSYGADGINITLGPAAHGYVESASQFRDEEEALPCGHKLWESNDEGECLWGCLHTDKVEENN